MLHDDDEAAVSGPVQGRCAAGTVGTGFQGTTNGSGNRSDIIDGKRVTCCWGRTVAWYAFGARVP
eukprot:2959919-Prorocentrum_lima.AAC.1